MTKKFFPSTAKLSLLTLGMLSTIALLITITAATPLLDRNDIENDQLDERNEGRSQNYFQGLKTEAKSSAESFGVTTLENKKGNIVRKVRNAIAKPERRWTNKTVPYVIDESLKGYTELIMASMDNFHQLTCLKFVPRSSESNYIWLFAGDGCYSNVGMTGRRQSVSLGDGCLFKGTIIHNLAHALGFYNEQQRSDRDQFLTIYWNNIQTGLQSEFALLQPSQNVLLVPFDTDSIMMNGGLYLSKDGRSQTMISKSGKKLLETYDKTGLSNADVVAIRKLYNC